MKWLFNRIGTRATIFRKENIWTYPLMYLFSSIPSIYLIKFYHVSNLTFKIRIYTRQGAYAKPIQPNESFNSSCNILIYIYTMGYMRRYLLFLFPQPIIITTIHELILWREIKIKKFILKPNYDLKFFWSNNFLKQNKNH